jgi:thiamine biosynthesis protein ThiS
MTQSSVVFVTFGGDKFACSPGTNLLEGLLSHIGTLRGRAVILNGSLVPRSAYERTVLQEGDTVEVLQSVAGG